MYVHRHNAHAYAINEQLRKHFWAVTMPPAAKDLLPKPFPGTKAPVRTLLINKHALSRSVKVKI